MALAERIDFVCNTYTTPSIRDVERNIRGSHNVRITGAEQICPKDFQERMKSCKFKSLLLRVLADEWRNQAYQKTYFVCWD